MVATLFPRSSVVAPLEPRARHLDEQLFALPPSPRACTFAPKFAARDQNIPQNPAQTPKARE